MVDLIAGYLSFRKQVSLEGIGTFSVEHLPARLDFPNRLLHAPQSILHFSSSASQDQEFEYWLSRELEMSEEKVKEQEQQFVAQFREKLKKQNTLEWKGIGNFSRDENGIIHFKSGFDPVVGEPVNAEKIIRKDASHFVRVGEEEKTNAEMEELLFGEKKKKWNSYWVIVVVLFIAGIAAIWYAGAADHSAGLGNGNQQKLKQSEQPVLYKIQ